MTESPFKAGNAVILGRPNAGKSTLINALLKFKLSGVSSKPQMTRHKILGILDGDGYQVCLFDTPGLIENPRDPLQETLKRTARIAAREDGDVLVLMVEPEPPSPEALAELSTLGPLGVPLILAINKTDLPCPPERLEAVEKAYREALKPAACLRLSALKGAGVAELLREIVSRLPESPALYEKGHLSDRWERFFAAELIREQIFSLYREEVPHAIAVVIEQFREEPGSPDHIAATLHVERDSQKGIVLGEKGRVLRDLANKSRSALENFLGRRVELDLWVKVRPNWRKDPRSLKEFGYIP